MVRASQTHNSDQHQFSFTGALHITRTLLMTETLAMATNNATASACPTIASLCNNNATAACSPHDTQNFADAVA